MIFFTCHLVGKPAGYLFPALSNSLQKTCIYNVPCIQKEFHECRISQLITIRSYKKQTMIENSWKRYSSLLVGKCLIGKQPDSYFHKKLGLYFCIVHKTEDLQFFAEFQITSNARRVVLFYLVY